MLHLEIVTPMGSVVERDVDEVVVPGALGEFGVLEGHIPLLSAMNAGVLRYRAEGKEELLAVGQGFAEVGARDCVKILTELSASPDEVNAEDVQNELSEAEAALKDWQGPTDTADHKQLREKVAWCQARLGLRE